MRKHRNLRARNARRDVIRYVLYGEVTWCFVESGRSKVVYPTLELATEAAQRLNRLPTSHHPGAPYRCGKGPHWHLRSARPEDDED